MNLLSNLQKNLPRELVTVLQQGQGVRIERIVSTGHRSPEEFWHEQAENEWVLVLKGFAVVQIEDQAVELNPGDYVNIPARTLHRVELTSAAEPTVWLAVFYGMT